MKNVTINIWLNKLLNRLDWKLLLFLVLVLNVKLVVKVIALLLFVFIERKKISFKQIVRQRYLFFYFGMIGIGLVNIIIQYKSIHTPYLLVAGLGILFWCMAIVAAFCAFQLVETSHSDKLNNSIAVFFLLHVFLVFFNLASIMVETSSINPYTYKGLNHKYFMSTGDSISGVTFDSPVITAMICAFGVLFFLYRECYFFSLLCMAGLLVIVSNLTNFFLVGSFVTAAIFRTSRVQKSMMVVFIMMMIVFIAKVSPQNNEYVVSFLYKLVGKAYYLPPVKILSAAELKQTPDSLLSNEQKRIKTGMIYIDSISAKLPVNQVRRVEKVNIDDTFQQNSYQRKALKEFNEYRPSMVVKEKENRFGTFLLDNYSSRQRDSFKIMYDWDKPGKEIAFAETIRFLKNHTNKIFFGAGIGNFSSRVAFKSAALDIAGSYPAKFRYIHPEFLKNHLYLYLYFHSQWQIKHTAANTPDSVYGQILSEYGIVGILIFLFFYIRYYTRRISQLSFGLPLLCLMIGAFFVEYWFEQLSVVILFELLMFSDIKLSAGNKVNK